MKADTFLAVVVLVATTGQAGIAAGPAASSGEAALRPFISAYQKCALGAAVNAAKRKQTTQILDVVQSTCASEKKRFVDQQVRLGLSSAEAGVNADMLEKNSRKIIGAYLLAVTAMTKGL